MLSAEALEKRREAVRRSYYKHADKWRAHYREASAKRRAADPDAHNAYRRDYDAKNRDRINEVRRQRRAEAKGVEVGHARVRVVRTPTEKRELARQQYARWAKSNPDKTAALAAARRARKLNATPAWADRNAIKAIYAEAARITAETGIEHEVDHYFPLKSDVVCGLHCEANLRVIPATENIKKHNRCPSQ